MGRMSSSDLPATAVVERQKRSLDQAMARPSTNEGCEACGSMGSLLRGRGRWLRNGLRGQLDERVDVTTATT